jgi:hypothetical protein
LHKYFDVGGDTIDEGMNTVQLAGTDWNDAVKAYNTGPVSNPLIPDGNGI